MLLHCTHLECRFLHFDNWVDLQGHYKDVHEEKMTPCFHPECGGILFPDTKMGTHTRLRHSSDRKCYFCLAELQNVDIMRDHMKNLHRPLIGLHHGLHGRRAARKGSPEERMQFLMEKLEEVGDTDRSLRLAKLFGQLEYDKTKGRVNYAVERLDGRNLEDKIGNMKIEFRPDKELPFPQTSPKGYADIGFETGHLASRANHRYDENAARSTYLMSNAVPMLKRFNRGAWKSAEMYVRELLAYWDELSVISGAIYDDKRPKKKTRENVWVDIPTHFYKVILMEREGEEMLQVFIMPHLDVDTREYCFFKFMEDMPLLFKMTGINFLPKCKADYSWKAGKKLVTHRCLLSNCRQTFSSEEQLRCHVVSDHKLMVCDECGSGFLNKAKFVRHLNTVHSDARIQCPQCPQKFTTKVNLETHKKAVHLGERNHTCHHCFKRFKSKSNLDAHNHHVHSNEKTFECLVCSSRFKTQSNLKFHHRRIHEERKVVPCDQCKKVFPTQSELNNHVREVHWKETNFTCGLCNKRFFRKRNCVRHLQLAHKIDVKDDDPIAISSFIKQEKLFGGKKQPPPVKKKETGEEKERVDDSPSPSQHVSEGSGLTQPCQAQLQLGSSTAATNFSPPASPAVYKSKSNITADLQNYLSPSTSNINPGQGQTGSDDNAATSNLSRNTPSQKFTFKKKLPDTDKPSTSFKSVPSTSSSAKPSNLPPVVSSDGMVKVGQLQTGGGMPTSSPSSPRSIVGRILSSAQAQPHTSRASKQLPPLRPNSRLTPDKESLTDEESDDSISVFSASPDAEVGTNPFLEEFRSLKTKASTSTSMIKSTKPAKSNLSRTALIKGKKVENADTFNDQEEWEEMDDFDEPFFYLGEDFEAPPEGKDKSPVVQVPLKSGHFGEGTSQPSQVPKHYRTKKGSESSDDDFDWKSKRQFKVKKTPPEGKDKSPVVQVPLKSGHFGQGPSSQESKHYVIQKGSDSSDDDFDWNSKRQLKFKKAQSKPPPFKSPQTIPLDTPHSDREDVEQVGDFSGNPSGVTKRYISSPSPVSIGRQYSLRQPASDMGMPTGRFKMKRRRSNPFIESPAQVSEGEESADTSDSHVDHDDSQALVDSFVDHDEHKEQQDPFTPDNTPSTSNHKRNLASDLIEAKKFKPDSDAKKKVPTTFTEPWAKIWTEAGQVADRNKSKREQMFPMKKKKTPKKYKK